MVKKITYCSMYVAIIFIMAFVPYLGFINFGVVAITIIPIVIVIATIHMRFIGALTSSLAMGFFSLGASLVYGDPLFAFFYPDISVLPRFLMGMGVYLLFRLMGEIKWWKTIILGVVAAFLNTLFVTSFLYLHHLIFGLEHLPKIGIWIGIIWLNSVVEMIVTGFASSVIWPLTKILIKHFDSEKNYHIQW